MGVFVATLTWVAFITSAIPRAKLRKTVLRAGTYVTGIP